MNSEIKSISTNTSDFSYRERIRLERCLFLLIKTMCKKALDYNLQGFTKGHIDQLSPIIANNLSYRKLNLIINQTFEIKVYLQTLSCENAYVRGDALSKLGLNKINVTAFIQEQLKSVIDKVYALRTEQIATGSALHGPLPKPDHSTEEI